jgi:hypothetical protein
MNTSLTTGIYLQIKQINAEKESKHVMSSFMICICHLKLLG